MVLTGLVTQLLALVFSVLNPLIPIRNKSRSSIQDVGVPVDELLGYSERYRAKLHRKSRLALHASERQVKRALAALRNRGLAASTGCGPAARWRRVSRPVEDE